MEKREKVMSYIEGIFISCNGGVTILQAAIEAYDCFRQFGKPIYIMHNDRIYHVELETKEAGIVHIERKK